MKCSICGEKIERTFLGKIIGTYIKEGKKLIPICSKCQKEQQKIKKETKRH